LISEQEITEKTEVESNPAAALPALFASFASVKLFSSVSLPFLLLILLLRLFTKGVAGVDAKAAF